MLTIKCSKSLTRDFEDDFGGITVQTPVNTTGTGSSDDDEKSSTSETDDDDLRVLKKENVKA